MNGFSLIELVIVVAVLGVLSAIAVPAFQNIAEDGRQAAAKSTLATIYKECEVDRMQANTIGHSGATTGSGVTYTGAAGDLAGTSCAGVVTGTTTGNTAFSINLSNGTKTGF